MASENTGATTTAPTHGDESTPKKAVGKVMGSRPVRAGFRYLKAQGNLLGGGLAYTALFSIVSALTIAWTVFMATLGGNQELQKQVIKSVNQALPGILKDGSGTGMVDPNSLILDTALNPASIIAALVLLWSAVSMMSNIRTSVQAMFGIVAPSVNFAVAKLRDLVGFIGMAFGIVLSSLLGTAASALGGVVMGWIGLGENPVIAFLLRVLGFVVAAAIAAVTFAFLFRVTAAVRPLRRDLWMGAALGGVVVQIVLTLGVSLVSVASDNPLLASAASLITLLLFVNILSRVLLLVAAFTANPPAPDVPKSPQEVHFDETPNFVTESAPHTLEWEHQDVTGQVNVDESLRPGTSKPRPEDRNPHVSDVRPDGEPMTDEPLGPVARIRLSRKATRLEREAVETRARLGQRPRIDDAERAYWEEQGVTGRNARGDQ